MRKLAQVYDSPPFVSEDAAGLLNSSQLNASKITETPTVLSGSIGKAGDIHSDSGDDTLAMSVLIPLGDFGSAQTCRPGKLFVPELHLYFILDELSANLFNGQRRHGALPPCILTANGWRKWMMRLNWIGYAKLIIFDRTAGASLFGRDNGKEKVFTLPVKDVDKEPRRVLNYPTDGINIMDAPQLVNFITRDISMLLYQIQRSAHPSLKLAVDHDRFFQCILYEHEGQRASPSNWKYNPSTSPNIQKQRLDIIQKGRDMRLSIMSSMPTQHSSPMVKDALSRIRPGGFNICLLHLLHVLILYSLYLCVSREQTDSC